MTDAPDRQVDRIVAALTGPPPVRAQAQALALLESALGWDWPRLADHLDKIDDLLCDYDLIADITGENTMLGTAADALRDIAEAGVALLDLFDLRGTDAPAPPPRPLIVAYQAVVLGDHVHVAVRGDGAEGHRPLLGTLICSHAEAAIITAALPTNVPANLEDAAAVFFPDDEPGPGPAPSETP